MSNYREIKSRIVSFITDNKLIHAGDKIVLAVSGGMDSMFLLRTLFDLKKELEIDIVIGHINHNIRENSDYDEQFVSEAADKIEIPIYIERLNFQEKSDNDNTEAWARKHRYERLEKIKKGLNFNKIATAHNSNDQVETILHRISEKSGIDGLQGIRKQSNNIVRPILTISRAEIESVSKELSLDYVEDETNRDISLKRNYFRHEIIPQWEKLYPNLGEAFQSVCDSADENKQILNYFFGELESQVVTEEQDSASKRISINNIKELPLEVKTSFISHLLGAKYWRKHNWNELKKIVLSAKIGKIYVLDEFEILKDRTEWIIRPKLKVEFKPKNVKIDDKTKIGHYTLEVRRVKNIIIDEAPNREFIDKEKIAGKQLVVRKWQDGDIFHPIGMRGTKKISDYLTDIKMNMADKENQLVITADNEIIWLCGQRLSDTVKIDDKTEQYLELSIKSNVG